jgi:Flp pilus assembly pilin Flp
MQNGIRNSMQNGIRNVLRDEAGQGVAEYIIILAVVVVAAIVLAIAFHEQLSAVWDSVTSQLGELA